MVGEGARPVRYHVIRRRYVSKEEEEQVSSTPFVGPTRFLFTTFSARLGPSSVYTVINFNRQNLHVYIYIYITKGVSASVPGKKIPISLVKKSVEEHRKK